MSFSSSPSSSVHDWLMFHISRVPSSSIGWFRAGVGFYNKLQFAYAVECFECSAQLDPLNYNCYQLMARALIALNRRSEAIEALKKSVKLDNPSDWQLLIELTAQENEKQKDQKIITETQANSSVFNPGGD
jgi:tetratricopeptide (TPR) repeat protein